jgi:hypothetical protein
MANPTQAEIKIKDLEQRLAACQTAAKRLKAKMQAEPSQTERFNRAYELLDNLVRAAETGDVTAIEQTAGAGREFLDKPPA